MHFNRPEILRPPSEHDSYFLPMTSGCSNNTCSFCGYHGTKLQVRELKEIKDEIDSMALYIRDGVRIPSLPEIIYYVLHTWNGKKVFLQDGDAIVYPYPRLVEALVYLKDKFPNLERIGSYATPQDILRRTIKELKDLRSLKLGILYMGVESGDDVVLQRIGKGVTHDQIVEAGRKVKEAGITLSVTIILGLGGVERSEQHVSETARILSGIDPNYAGALTLTMVSGTPLYKQWRSGGFSLINPLDSLAELKAIIEQAEFSNCFFSSMHASNYLSIRGTFPAEKTKVLEELDYVLQKKDSTMLRPEFLRGL